MTTRARVDLPDPEFANDGDSVAPAHVQTDVVDDFRLPGIVGADMLDGENRDLVRHVRFDEGMPGHPFAHQAAGIFLFRLLQDLS